MNAKEKVLIPYNLYLMLASAFLLLCSLIMLTVTFFTSPTIFILLSFAFLLASVSVAIQCKKVVLRDRQIIVKHFLGIVKEQKFSPVECGLFVAQRSLPRPTYIDKRVMHGESTDEYKKFIYLCDYALSKQEMEGSQYIYGEPILILKYSPELYASLSKSYVFNCEDFKSIDKSI